MCIAFGLAELYPWLGFRLCLTLSLTWLLVLCLVWLCPWLDAWLSIVPGLASFGWLGVVPDLAYRCSWSGVALFLVWFVFGVVGFCPWLV